MTRADFNNAMPILAQIIMEKASHIPYILTMDAPNAESKGENRRLRS